MTWLTTRRGLGVLAGALVAGVATAGAAGIVRAQTAPEGPPATGPFGMPGWHGGVPGRLSPRAGEAMPGMPGMPGMMGRDGMMGGHDVEAHFIQEMIPHHEDAVAMAGLALQRAEHAELKELAAAINATQTAEIEQMRTWYRDWYGTDVPPSAMASMPGGRGMGRMTGGGLAALAGASAFDRAFIEEMVPHHQMAVMMATMALKGTQRPELRTLLQSIIAGQSAEIERMLGWYRAWVGTPLRQRRMGRGR